MSKEFVPEEDRRRLRAFIADYQASSYAESDDGEPIGIVPSPIDERMVHDHENLLGATLPSLFRAYLLGSCLPNTDLYVSLRPTRCANLRA